MKSPLRASSATLFVWTRVGVIAGMGLLALLLKAVNPTTLSWLPFRASCGAITGLPCLFCGTTRAIHHLLNGDLAQAVYFNWLAFPVAAIAIAVFVKSAAELVLFRRIELGSPALRLTPRGALAGAILVVLLWSLQVSLALAFHKHELLNPNGFLYALLVR